MLTLRRGSIPAAILGLALALTLATHAHAQESSEPADPQPADPQPADPQPAEAPPDEQAVAAPRQARPAPPPIMVVVLTSGRVPEEIVSAARAGLVDQLTTMAGGRPVHGLAVPSIRDAIRACRDDACLGAQLAQAGAQAGVILRVQARARRPYATTIELRDPVSGIARAPAMEGELPLDAAQVPNAARAMAEQLRAAMPTPPLPPSMLLVTVNVDGARVAIDGNEIGTSPVAPVEVSEGSHEIVVMMHGHLSVRRQARVQPGEQARVDVTLQAIAGAGGGEGGELAGEGPVAGGDVTGEWWFWTAIGGGAALLIGIAIGLGVALGSGAPAQMDPTGIMLPPIMGGL